MKFHTVFLGAALLISAVTPAQLQAPSRLRLIPIVSDQRLEDIQESPDHTRLLTHDRGYAPRLWEPKSMRLLGVLPHKFSPVSQALLSDSGLLIGTISEDEARLWDAKSARVLNSWDGFESKSEKFARIAIAPDDKTVAIAGEKGTIWIARAPLFKLEKLTTLPGDQPIKDIQFSPDSKLITACAVENPTILTYNISTNNQSTYPGPTEGSAWVEISPDNKQLLVTGLDNQAHLYSIDTQKELKTFEHIIGEKGFAPQTLMAALFVGKDLGEIIVCGSTGTMTIYDRNTFEKKRELTGYSHPIREIRKTKDGLKVATYEDNDYSDSYDPLKIYDVETTKEYPFNRAGEPTAGAFNPEGTIFWVGYNSGDIVQHRLSDGEWNTSTISNIRVLNQMRIVPNTGRVFIAPKDNSTNFFAFDAKKVHFDDIYSAGEPNLKVSPNGLFALSPGYFQDENGEDASGLGCWEIATQKNALLFNDSVVGIEWLADNTLINWTDKYVSRWNPALENDPSTEEINEKFIDVLFEPINRTIRWAKPSDDGAYVLIKSIASEEDDTDYYNVVTVETGNADCYFSDKEYLGPNAFALHKDQPVIVTRQKALVAYDINGSKVLWSVPHTSDIQDDIAYSADGSYLLEISNTKITKYNPQTGEVIESIGLGDTMNEFYLTSYFDKNAQTLAVTKGRQIAFFRTDKLSGIRTITRPDTIIDAQWLSDKNRLVIIDATDQTTIWDTKELLSDEDSKNIQPLGTFVLMQSTPNDPTAPRNSWLVMDRDGRFDAPDPNKITGASYVLEWDEGLEPIDVSQLKSLYYEPGLFGKLIGFDPEPPRSVPDRKSIRLFPEIKIERSTKNTNRISVTLTDRDEGGVGKTEIYLNSKLIETKDKTGFISINLEDYKSFFLPKAQLPEGHGNILSIVSSNQRGDLKSLPATLDVGIPENLTVPEVNIYGLFVGIGDYAGAKKDLSAPPMDAKKLSEAVGESAERLLPKHVHITTITTDDKTHMPDRQPILDWFADVATKATSSDIIVVFFAGHGTSQIGDKSGYFFLTAGADPGDITPGVLGVHTISSEDLQAALAKIPASKQVIILDTCHSGAAANDIIKDRASGSDYIRAYESIRDSAGTWLLAGAAADQLSYESRSVDHGLLTYSLLEALDRVSPDGLRATPSGELFLDVDRWFTYAASRVESLRNEIGIDGVQKPEIRKGATNQTFDIGVTREQFRGEVGLKPPKPIVLMGTFDEDQEDPLQLEAALSEALKDEPSYKLWLNVTKHPNVFRISGRYTTDGDKVTLRLFIQKFDVSQVRKNLGDPITITGVAQDIPGLVQKIRETIAKELPALTKSSENPPPNNNSLISDIWLKHA
jgi:WD40 repeat protein